MKKTHSIVALAAAGTLALAGCGGSSSDTEETSSAAAPASATDLSGVCPATVTVQLDWEPEADYAGIFAMLGSDYKVDADAKRVTGSLVDGEGNDTGVDLQIRSGGAAIGFQSVSSQMYVDKDILLGTVSTDQAIAAAASQPVVQVAATQRFSPYVLYWDPETYPDVHTIADLAAADVPILVAKSTAFPDWLVGQGIIDRSELDTSYDGTNARFVSDPSIAVEGYATNTPYLLEKETPAWGKQVSYQLLKDVGYEMYPSALSVRAEDVEAQADCLSALIPVYQSALKAYMADPTTYNTAIVAIVDDYQSSWVYSQGVADYAAEQFKDEELVSNETDGTLGSFDMARQQRNIDSFASVLADSGADVPDGLTADDIATTKFVDPSIALD
ncbi:hypothetical protein [Nocardioides sp.]|uniref:hypothetical protein n=1 Tax=Nocardioides sp. TaxID=35761 RepID=UPI0039E46883